MFVRHGRRGEAVSRTPPLMAPIDKASIRPVRTHEDVDAVITWIETTRPSMSVDTETTGLDYHAEVRLVQFGDHQVAWVVDPHRWPEVIHRLAAVSTPLVAHNAPFDMLHLARFLDAANVVGEVAALMERTTDTAILSHLVDPRDSRDGGIGHGLKNLAHHYVDPAAPDSDAELKAVFKALGFKVGEGYAKVPINHETFVTYAGTDAILTARLHEVLTKMVADLGLEHLSGFEHRTQRITTAMTARGFKVDRAYAHELSEELAFDQQVAEEWVAANGVTNVNSTKQVADALVARGAVLTETTPSGALKVDKTVLAGIDDELANQVLVAKNSSKFLSSYVDPMIEAAHIDGRVHCRIKSLAARTGRQAISQPPLQQLPSGDHRIRSCLVSDDGMALVAADFSQVEFRVLAALANEQAMIDTFTAGGDLHDVTAARLFGERFTPAQRRLAKGVGFGLIYGGGTSTLARQAGVSDGEARFAIEKFLRAYPRVKRWTRQIVEQMKYGEPLVVTATGRRIPLERRFGYRAVNYMVQSLAADIFKGSLIQLDDAGLGEHLLLPVHDEVIAQAPVADAEEFAAEMATTMGGHLGPVPITAEGEVLGTSWGDKYDRT